MESVSPQVLTVSQLTLYLKSVIDGDYHFNNILLSGEISNFTRARSGHLYFTLKDEKAAIRAVMFRSNAARLPFELEDGMKLIVFGSVSIYPANGQYQIYVENMQPDGLGALSLAFEQLKDRLQKEGLFDESHKKPIPPYPMRIGVVTSPTGAAFQDIKKVLRRRWPAAEIVLCPAMVQGKEAPAQIATALRTLDHSGCDVILAARGGGSMEDLWCFNDEMVARTVYAMQTPVVSGVGHQTDTTLIDFVADLRVPTPSAAAEVVSPNASEEYDRTLIYKNKMRAVLQNQINEGRARIQYLKTSNVLRSFSSLLDERRLRLDLLTDRLWKALPEQLADRRLHLDRQNERLVRRETELVRTQRTRLSVASGKLVAYNPLQVLSRGYGLVQNEKGMVVDTVIKVTPGDNLIIRMRDGRITARAEEIHSEENENG